MSLSKTPCEQVLEKCKENNVACLLFSIEGFANEVEFLAHIDDSFLGNNFERQYDVSVQVIAIMRKIGDMITHKLQEESGDSLDSIKKDVAEAYYHLNKDI